MHGRPRLTALLSAATLALGLAAAPPAAAEPDGLVSLGTNLQLLDISDDGTVLVHLGSDAQIYAEDRTTGAVTLVSSADGVTPAAGFHRSGQAQVSRNGRFVTFTTLARNLDPDDTDYLWDVYLKDLSTGTLTLVSRSSAGVKGNLSSYGPAPVSDDGQVVVFASEAGNFPPEVTVAPSCQLPEPDKCVQNEVYAKNLVTGALTLLTRGTRDEDDEVGDAISSTRWGAMSADGTKVAINTADTLSADDVETYPFPDVYVIDLGTGVATLASNDAPAAFASFFHPSLSADGSRVAFSGDLPGGSFVDEVFVRDLARPLPVRASATADGTPANRLAILPVISPDGGFVSFTSGASNLHPDDADTLYDVFHKDLTTGEVRLVSAGPAKPADSYSAGAIATLAGGLRVVFSAPLNHYDPAAQPWDFGIFLRTFAPSGPVDANGDGVVDDLQPAGTPPGAFVDAGTTPPTTGSVVSTGGLAMTVADAPDAADGVLVTTGPAGAGTTRTTLSVCGMTVRLDPGSSVVLTCGSLVVRTLTGRAEASLDDGAIVVVVPAGASARVVDTVSGADVTGITGSGVTVTVRGATTTLVAGATTSFSSHVVTGPTAPVDPQPVLNRVKAGRAVPIKWTVRDASGAPVTTLSTATVTTRNLACGLGVTTDDVEQTFAGGSGLQNLGNGEYQLNWKTSTAHAGSCKTMVLDLGSGLTLQADFQLTR